MAKNYFKNQKEIRQMIVENYKIPQICKKFKITKKTLLKNEGQLIRIIKKERLKFTRPNKKESIKLLKDMDIELYGIMYGKEKKWKNYMRAEAKKIERRRSI